MPNLAAVIQKAGFTLPVSIDGLAKRLGMPLPVSLEALAGKVESLPTELDWSWNPITFNDGVPVGGSANLSIHQDGTYNFSGAFHDSGATEYNVSFVCGIKDSANTLYTFQQAGHVAGTLEAGSRDFTWSVTGQNDDLSKNWTNLSIGATSSHLASATLDLVNLVNTLVGAAGLVTGVIGIVVA